MSANEQIMIPASELVHEYVRLAKIEELEKIKTEIEPLPITDTAIRLVSKVIDKRISELKGE